MEGKKEKKGEKRRKEKGAGRKEKGERRKEEKGERTREKGSTRKSALQDSGCSLMHHPILSMT